MTRALLDQGFKRYALERLDPKGQTREWLAGRFTPQAVREGLAVFGTEREKGRLKNDMAHRYLVKVIQGRQDEIDLRRQEELLLQSAETQRSFWLAQLEAECRELCGEHFENAQGKETAFSLAEKAVFGGLPIQRAFWEKQLYRFLVTNREYFTPVINHVRRFFESDWENRFSLISKLIEWELELDKPIAA